MLTLLVALSVLALLLHFNLPQKERVACVGMWICFAISLFFLNDYATCDLTVQLNTHRVWVWHLGKVTPIVHKMITLLIFVASCLSFVHKNINFIKKIIIFCIFSVTWFVAAHVSLYLLGGVMMVLSTDAPARSKYVRASLLVLGVAVLAFASRATHLDGLYVGALQCGNVWTRFGYACWLVALWYNARLFPLVDVGDDHQVPVTMKIFYSLAFVFGLSQFLQSPLVTHREVLASLAALTSLGGILLAARTQKMSDVLRHTLTLYVGMWIALACLCPAWPSYETTLLVGMVVYVLGSLGMALSLGLQTTLTDALFFGRRSPWVAIMAVACLTGLLLWPLLSDVGVIMWRARAWVPLTIFALCLPLLGFTVFRWVRSMYRRF